MREHIDDERQFTYSLEELENGETHDELWNAAQREMVATGEMHNYVRMLWGKNVIAWSPSYEIAFETLVHLNNKYCLDGRDPNSYAGTLVFWKARPAVDGTTGVWHDPLHDERQHGQEIQFEEIC